MLSHREPAGAPGGRAGTDLVAAAGTPPRAGRAAAGGGGLPRPSPTLRSWLAAAIPPATPGELARFVTVFSLLRWSTLSVAVVLGLVEGHDRSTLVAGGLIGAFDLWLALSPPRYERGGWRISATLLAEVALGVGAVEATGFGSSPFLLTLGMATTIAGFAGGLRIVSGLAVIAGLSVALPVVVLSQSELVQAQVSTAGSVQLATLIVLVGGVGGYGRYLVEDASRVRRGLAASVERLSKVNTLLLNLHSAAEEVAAPLDLKGAAKWAFDRLEAERPAEVVAVLVREPATGRWHVAEGKGLRGVDDGTFSLPPALLMTATGDDPVLLGDLGAEGGAGAAGGADDGDGTAGGAGGGDGLSSRSRWGLYAPLRARDELLGMLVVESSTELPQPPPDPGTLADLARTAALALDNARWLERIHVFAAEQERARLARDLHDRVGQSVVYLGLELDRLAQLDVDQRVRRDLLALREDLRAVVRELRDTLADLRTDVSEDVDLAALLASFVDRVNRRGKVAVALSTEVGGRLPVVVEREMWRIAQEAVLNAERHARATRVSVTWSCSERGALLEVTDDGIGLDAARERRRDGASGYGLLGMQERADAIRARLQVVSHRGRGTTVRAQWGTP